MNYSHVTFLLCLPRSRSAWLAEFVKPYCAASWHCPLQQCASIDELGKKIDAVPGPGRIFIADVAAMFFFDKLLVRFPGAKYLVVHRPAHEVEASMRKKGVTPPLAVRNAEKQLVEIGRAIRGRQDAMAGRFFELNSPSLLKLIGKFITGEEMSSFYVQRAAQKKIDVPVSEQIARTDFLKQRTLFRGAKIIH